MLMGTLLSDKYTDGLRRVTQVTGVPEARALAALDHLVVCLPAAPPAAVWRDLPQGPKLKALLKRSGEGAVPAMTTRLANERQTAVSVGLLASDTEPFEQLSFARKLLAPALGEKSVALGIAVLGFDASQAEGIAERLVSAALAHGFALADFKSKREPQRIRSLRLLGLERRLDLSRVLAEARGNNLARWLTALPPNKLDARAYIDLLEELAKQQGWQFRKYGMRELAKLGAGAFLAVAQGNANDSAAIVRLRYRPDSKAPQPALGLVGKGIIFDTGGTNLKPFASMSDMHIDMGGSAVAVGTLLALTALGWPHEVDCWCAITENRTGPTAYKSQDVVTALNGKTVQTIHTDAEGRMVLADTLALASRERPRLIVDFATLTGACITAVTTRYSGVFTNRPELHPVLKRAGRESGERVWPFPAGKEFLEDLKSETADIAQCLPDGAGDHILAATFLNEFVPAKIPWIHVDLSAAKCKGGLAHVPTEITGFGVRYALQLLLNTEVGDL